jgi:hypothetical protein
MYTPQLGEAREGRVVDNATRASGEIIPVPRHIVGEGDGECEGDVLDASDEVRRDGGEEVLQLRVRAQNEISQTYLIDAGHSVEYGFDGNHRIILRPYIPFVYG